MKFDKSSWKNTTRLFHFVPPKDKSFSPPYHKGATGRNASPQTESVKMIQKEQSTVPTRHESGS